jgi:hypothetical protein
LLRTAYEGIKALADNSRANPDSLARCQALQLRVQYDLAYVDLDENKRDEAVALFRDLLTFVPEAGPYRVAIKHALEVLDSGRIPTDPLPH